MGGVCSKGDAAVPASQSQPKDGNGRAALEKPGAEAANDQGDDNREKPRRSVGRETSTVYREQLINLHAKYKKMGLEERSDEDDDDEEESSKGGGGDQKESSKGGDRAPQGKPAYQRFQNVFAAPLKMVEDFVAPIFPKSREVTSFLNQVLEDNFIFAGLTGKERQLLVQAMQHTKVPEGEVVIQQGDIGDFFYIIDSGEVIFTVDGVRVGQAFRGASFGELALLYDAPRAATVTAAKECHLYKVDQQTFRTLMANNKVQAERQNVDVLQKVEFFKDIEVPILNKISEAMTEIRFHNGDSIVRKGEDGEVFYIIKEGKVSVTDIGLGGTKYVDQTLGVGDFFGERALLTGEKRAANVSSVGECAVLAISKTEFETIMGSLEKLIERAADRRTLMGIPVFAKAKLEPFELDKLVDTLAEKTFKKGQLLLQEGQPLPADVQRGIYLIKEGEITVQNNAGSVNVLHRGDYAGQALIHYEDGQPAPISVTCTRDARCRMLTVERIREALDGGFDRLSRETSLIANRMDISANNDTIEKITILGAGTFGQVWLVSDKRVKAKTYALKIQSKKELIRSGQVQGVIREKNLMASIDHPFVIKLVNAYQDAYNLYMIMSLAQGGELFSIIHTEKTDGVSESAAMFYAANIFDGLMHLHSKSILYRDLKPENVLIDHDGYCVLIDLGFAKVVTDKTYTLCGTPLYLAPEILLSRGYDKSVDNWSFGVLLFEMLFGYSPFYTKNIDQMELYKRIVKIKYHFPSWCEASSPAKDLIRKILVLRPTERLGGLANGDWDIRHHPWLATLSQEDMLSKTIRAPWVPKIKSATDCSNFDNWDHLEDKAKHRGQPPSQKDQALFQNF